MKYYIYNPFAGNSKSITIDSKIIDCTKTNKMNELEKNLKKGDKIFIIGGDGTLRYLLNHHTFLFNYSITYIKAGSGNDFYRSLDGKKTYYYELNNKYNFINCFGMGFDAQVCEKVNKLDKKNTLSYLVEAYKCIKHYEPFNLTISYDNITTTFNDVWLCSLQNGKYFGGGLKIARNAKLEDERIDLCIAHNLNKFNVFILLMFVKFGLVHHFKKYYTNIRVKNFTIHNNEKRTIQLDGDVIELTDDITLTNKKSIAIKRGQK